MVEKDTPVIKSKEEKPKDDRKYFEIHIPRINVRNPNYVALLVVALAIESFALGLLANKVSFLEKTAKDTTTAVAAANTQNAPQAAPTQDLSPKKVSVANDPVMGDANAPVTMIEFSDYECPFCKQFFTDTESQIVKDYVDTGKVKIVYRNLPLPFHDPMSTTESIAALCVRAQSDDATYFKFHDLMFKNTTSNGTGLTKDQLYQFSDSLGLNTDALKTCMDDPKQADVVKKDIADATAAGANATPTFFIGKSTSDGVINGTPVIGAQPYSVFQQALDAALKS